MSESRFTQAMRMFGLSFAALTMLMLVGCGKRPPNVDAPDSVTDDNFPQIYPDPKTDPK